MDGDDFETSLRWPDVQDKPFVGNVVILGDEKEPDASALVAFAELLEKHAHTIRKLVCGYVYLASYAKSKVLDVVGKSRIRPGLFKLMSNLDTDEFNGFDIVKQRERYANELIEFVKTYPATFSNVVSMEFHMNVEADQNNDGTWSRIFDRALVEVVRASPHLAHLEVRADRLSGSFLSQIKIPHLETLEITAGLVIPNVLPDILNFISNHKATLKLLSLSLTPRWNVDAAFTSEQRQLIGKTVSSLNLIEMVIDQPFVYRDRIMNFAEGEFEPAQKQLIEMYPENMWQEMKTVKQIWIDGPCKLPGIENTPNVFELHITDSLDERINNVGLEDELVRLLKTDQITKFSIRNERHSDFTTMWNVLPKLKRLRYLAINISFFHERDVEWMTYNYAARRADYFPSLTSLVLQPTDPQWVSSLNNEAHGRGDVGFFYGLILGNPFLVGKLLDFQVAYMPIQLIPDLLSNTPVLSNLTIINADFSKLENKKRLWRDVLTSIQNSNLSSVTIEGDIESYVNMLFNWSKVLTRKTLLKFDINVQLYDETDQEEDESEEKFLARRQARQDEMAAFESIKTDMNLKIRQNRIDNGFQELLNVYIKCIQANRTTEYVDSCLDVILNNMIDLEIVKNNTRYDATVGKHIWINPALRTQIRLWLIQTVYTDSWIRQLEQITKRSGTVADYEAQKEKLTDRIKRIQAWQLATFGTYLNLQTDPKSTKPYNPDVEMTDALKTLRLKKRGRDEEKDAPQVEQPEAAKAVVAKPSASGASGGVPMTFNSWKRL